MKYVFFRIPVADWAKAEFNPFCTQNRVVSIDKQFVVAGAHVTWAFSTGFPRSCVECWFRSANFANQHT
ncbi:hypothetical protein ACH50O_07880 [Methylomonas sp. 2BW1-5-20]|uniref:hypothetical protein n=1 Tax=Methylomonas sp. 2BW1-5-20 TaxID=3376686 RepID=UPI00405188A6